MTDFLIQKKFLVYGSYIQGGPKKGATLKRDHFKDV